jgi:hypothetical protein
MAKLQAASEIRARYVARVSTQQMVPRHARLAIPDKYNI